MRTYSIAYVTPWQENIASLKKQGEKETKFSIEPIALDADIEVLVQEIISSGAEALVTDYKLNGKKASVSFSGVDVVNKIRSEKEGFPVFILSQDTQEAEEKAHEVHIVYDKKNMLHQDSNFFQRIKKQILKYNQELEAKEDRLIQLMSQSTPLTQQQEQEVMALNFSLEKSLDKQNARSLNALTPSSQDKLKDLLGKIDVMIQEVSQK